MSVRNSEDFIRNFIIAVHQVSSGYNLQLSTWYSFDLSKPIGRSNRKKDWIGVSPHKIIIYSFGINLLMSGNIRSMKISSKLETAESWFAAML